MIHSSRITAVDAARPAIGRPGTWPLRAVLAAFGLGGLLLAARWLTRSRHLFDLDAILYVRALDHYDLRLIQPPLPGYYLYIQMGRIVRGLLEMLGIHDPNLAFVGMSFVFGLLLAAALYPLGAELWDRRTGAIAAVFGLTGPIFWYQSGLASPRIAEGFFAALIVWLGVRLRRRGEAWVFWLLPPLFALASGVRQQSLLYLLPFIVWATWRTPLWMRAAGAVLLGLGIAAWAVPMLQSSGGLAEYRRMNNELYQLFVVSGTGVLSGRGPADMLHRLAVNCLATAIYLFFACLLGLPLLALAALARRKQVLPDLFRSLAGQTLLLATLPALLFFAFIHVQQIGHALAVAPFLVLACARVVAAPARFGLPAGASVLLAAVIAVTNLGFVFLAPAKLVGNRIGTPTVAAIRSRDRFIARSIRAVKAAGSPDTTLLFTTSLSYGFIEQYLPGYRYYLLPGLFEGGDRAVSRQQHAFTNGKTPIDAGRKCGEGCYAAPPGARTFVTFAFDADIARMLEAPHAAERPAADVPSLAVVRRDGPVRVHFAPGRLNLVSGPGDRGRGLPGHKVPCGD